METLPPQAIDELAVVWINRRCSQPGTYESYKVHLDEKEDRMVIELQREPVISEIYDPATTFLALEAPFKPGRRFTEESLAGSKKALNLPEFETPQDPYIPLDRPFRLWPSSSNSMPDLKPNLVEGQNSLALVKPEVLRKRAYPGITVRVGGIDFNYQLAELNCLLINPNRGTIMVSSRNSMQRFRYTSFQLSEARVRRLPDKLSERK